MQSQIECKICQNICRIYFNNPQAISHNFIYTIRQCRTSLCQLINPVHCQVYLSHKLRVSSRDACQAALLRHHLITSIAQTNTYTPTHIPTHTQTHADCASSCGVTFRSFALSLFLLVWLSAFASADKCRANKSYIQIYSIYFYVSGT